MSAADDMIEHRLERDLALADGVPRRPRSPEEAAAWERMRNVLAFYEANDDGDWPDAWADTEFDRALDDLQAAWASQPREPWVRPGARGEVEGVVTSTLIDAIGGES